MRSTITLFLITLCYFASAQDIAWHKILPGNNSFNPMINHSAVAADAGGYWVSHLSEHKMSFGQMYLGNYSVVHFDEVGNADDSIQFSGKACVKWMKSVNNKLYLRIGFFDSMSVENESHYSPGDLKYLLGVYDQNGFNTLEITADTISCMNITADEKIVALSSAGFGGTIQMYLYQPGGGFFRQKSLDNLGFVMSVEPLSNGGFIITGSCMASKVNLDKIAINNSFTYTNYILYLDQNLEGQWLKYIEDVTCTPSVGTGDGKTSFWLSTTYGKPVFDSLKYDGTNTFSNSDFFMVKIEDSNYTWVREIPGDTLLAQISTGSQNTLGVDNEGNVYMLATFRGHPIHWDSNTVSGVYTNSSDIMLMSWTKDGIIRWIKDMGGIANEGGSELVVRGVDNLLFSAIVTNSFSLGKDSVYADYGDIMVVKIGEGTTAVNTVKNSLNTLKLYPNPANKMLYHNQTVQGNYQIYSVNGSVCQRGNIMHNQPVDIGNLQPGVYLFCTGDQHERFVKTE